MQPVTIRNKMSHYRVKQLGDVGSQFAMAMLLNSLQFGEPFITYGAIKKELEHQLQIENIFSTHIGHVAGSLMNRILEIDPEAPLINVLITRPNGLPGKGAGSYFADRYKVESYRKWDEVPPKKKRHLVNLEREKILLYNNWEKLNAKLFGPTAKDKIRKEIGSEQDGFSKSGKNYGGPAESDEHKKLKAWVACNPDKIGLMKEFGIGETESSLLSGDTIDVLFSNGINFATVEVKSCRSNDDDFRRGIYQCVKYRKIKEAEHFPYRIKVKTVLVTERELNPELKERARLLKVEFKQVKVNNR